MKGAWKQVMYDMDGIEISKGDLVYAPYLKGHDYEQPFTIYGFKLKDILLEDQNGKGCSQGYGSVFKIPKGETLKGFLVKRKLKQINEGEI